MVAAALLLSCLLGVDALSADSLASREEGNPLPVHLLTLGKEEAGPAPTFFNWDLCNVEVSSNLGGLGPDSGPEQLRFGKVGEYFGVGMLDLVVINSSTYVVNENTRNTARGCFGVVNVAKESSVDLVFTFVQSGTDTPVVIKEPFFMSFFDLDESATGAESLTMWSGFDDFYVSPETELGVTTGANSMSFTASTFGVGADNPPPMEVLQKSRTVTFKMNSASSVGITYKVAASKRGRNFLIGGKSVLVPPPKGTTTTTTMTGAPKCVDGSCIVWGDPHIITFDVNHQRQAKHPVREAFFRTRGWKADQVSVYDEGTFWLVKSDRVHIQGRYWHNKTHPEWTNLGALAIGGPFLGNNTLVFRTAVGATTWNGEEILPIMPSEFVNEFIQARYHAASELVKDGKPGPGVEISLPDGMTLLVNRWRHNLAVKISMCAQERQDGQCGNFNGKVDDDSQDELLSRLGGRISTSEYMF